jgi:hypothetical protein
MGMGSRLGEGQQERILTGFSIPASTECFQLLQDSRTNVEASLLANAVGQPQIQ